MRRCVRGVFQERLLGEAAAVAFYALLAVFPALASLPLFSGMVVDPLMAAKRRTLLTTLSSGRVAGVIAAYLIDPWA